MLSDLSVAHKLINLQHSAKKREVEFNLSFKKLKQLMLQKKCYYTGLEFQQQIEGLTRSIDRVDNTKGYVDDNVVACVAQFNSLKGQLTPDDIILIYTKVFSFLNRKKDAKPPKKAVANKATVPTPNGSKNRPTRRKTVARSVDAGI